MNDILAVVEAWTPSFFFHYIIVILCVAFIMCIAVLKFKYLYWYNQPLTFRFTLRRFGSGGGGRQTSIMNPLSLGQRCYNAVVYPFLNYVNHIDVNVADASDETEATIIYFERIAAFLSRPETEITTPARIGASRYIEGGCIPCDTLRIILSQPTFGLSPFIGLLRRSQTDSDAAASIKGVSVLTPRIMMSFDGGRQLSVGHSLSIYMCDFLAWERYTTSERESLELIETTEYIQKSREIAGEQTLYRYHEIPWFVIPFTTVYTYTFRMPAVAVAAAANLGNGMSVVRVSSANMALFYSFVNECSRDFRCCIFNEFTQLQSLVTHGIYRIYILLFNHVRVVAAYIFAPSWMKTATVAADDHLSRSNKRNKRATTVTKANRISELHEYISNTSTALVKYIPPVITPQYDAFGKRVSREKTMGAAAAGAGQRTSDDSILLLLSSIQHKSLCENTDFVAGFYSAATSAAAATTASAHHMKTNPHIVMIDTLAHNYRLIDDIITGVKKPQTPTPTIAWQLLSQDKWNYILYNAIIHEPTLCKDILMI